MARVEILESEVFGLSSVTEITIFIFKNVTSILTLCNPMDFTVRGILQVRILEWVAFPFSKDLPNPGIKPRSPALQADSLPTEPQGKPQVY